MNEHNNSSVVWVFKPIGWTPKDCIIEYQKTEPKKMAFAGRLDPMAYGLLPLIIHQQNIDTKQVQEKKASLQSSYKTYQFKLVLGFESDTYDILGLVKSKEINKDFLNDIEKVTGPKIQSYPPYSSQKAFSPHYNKKVPLWKLAKEDHLPDIMPTKEIDIRSIKILGQNTITNNEFLELIKIRFSSLLNQTNYRNDEILSRWQETLQKNDSITVYHLEARVSTGTYIRSIGNNLGGIVYDICRTCMDTKTLENLDKYDKFKFVHDV